MAALAAFLLLVVYALATVASAIENTAIVRLVDLGGSLVHVSTTYTFKDAEGGASTYTFALSTEEQDVTRFIEARVKGQSSSLPLKKYGFNPRSHSHLYEVTLPNTLAVSDSLSIIVDTVQSHATHPWPKEATQGDTQSLKYDADLFVISPYKTVMQRTKFSNNASPRILSYTTPRDVSKFTKETPVSKSGAAVTYGPFNNVQPSNNFDFFNKIQQRVTIHYGYDNPVLTVKTLKRAAEISHWGANLNINDDIWLQNTGPTLKGQFSRLEHQQQAFYRKPAPHVLSGFAMPLPPGIHSTYFYDTIGNVSTSKLRVASPESRQSSILELKPRYPLLGGWNYTFTLGWDSPLALSSRYDAKTNQFTVAIPIITIVPGAVYEEAEVKVVLPEGSTDIEVFPPFAPLDMIRSAHVTYLDTVGRPAITFIYRYLTDKHNSIIYVKYAVPTSAHFTKPLAVATGAFSLFMLVLAARRVDPRIHKTKTA